MIQGDRREERLIMARRDLREYEAKTPMTSEERVELRKWVREGNSPYENPWLLYGDNGCLIDFVSAMRFDEELCEEFRNKTPEELVKFYQQQDEQANESPIDDNGIIPFIFH
jgi:hypothetical protein